MAIQRGLAYALDGASAETVAVLVVTNDHWNSVMYSVGVVPLRRPIGDPSPLAPIVDTLQAFAGRLVAVEKSSLGPARLVLDAGQMAAVEDALCEVLALGELCRTSPSRPASPPGPVTYPRWAEIYYVAGQRFDEEHKRYVVVSNDDWNRADGTAIAVRTTTTARRWGTAFPAIQDGAARACCGDAATFAARRFNLRNRPQPRWLPLADMAAIARGLAETHQLQPAVERRLRQRAP